MIDSSSTRSGSGLFGRRGRIGGSNVLRHIAEKPAVILNLKNEQIESFVVGAAGFDIQVATVHPLNIGQRAIVNFGLSDSEMGIAIPGVVHWVGSGATGPEVGIALQERLPEEFSVSVPGCQRNGIRYACRVPGTLLGKDGTSTSCGAVAVNYSRDGVCLQTPGAPPVESRIQFTWKTATQERSMEAMVRWVIGQEGGFLMGCELIDDVGYSLKGVKV